MHRMLVEAEKPDVIAKSWAFTVLYCAIAFAMFGFAVLVWRELAPILVTGFFAAFGLFYIWVTARMTLDHGKFGEVLVRLVGPDPAPGGRLTAAVWFAGSPRIQRLKATLTCYRGLSEQHRQPIWRGTDESPLRSAGKGRSGAIEIDIPPDADGGQKLVKWELRLVAEDDGADLDRTFKVDVGPAVAGYVRPPPTAKLAAVPEARPKPEFSGWLLVAVNLIPIFGVAFLGWKVADVILIFWIENVVIGGYNLLRIFAARPKNLDELVAKGLHPANGSLVGEKLMVGGFFALHYGFFCVAHVSVLAEIFGARQGAWPMIRELLGHTGMAVAVLAMVLSHGVSFVRNFIGRGEYLAVDFGELMSRPYKRVFVVHIFIIAGGFALQALKSPALALIIFIAIKIAIDYRMHKKEHQDS